MMSMMTDIFHPIYPSELLKLGLSVELRVKIG